MKEFEEVDLNRIETKLYRKLSCFEEEIDNKKKRKKFIKIYE